MNQPGGLTDEMTQYITEGTCPRCGVVILSPEYVNQRRLAINARILNNLSYVRPRPGLSWLDPLTPAGAKVELNGLAGMKCLTCMNTWSFYPPLPRLGTAGRPGLFRAQPAFKLPTASQPPVAGPKWLSVRPTPHAATSINVANYRLIGVKDEQRIETVLREETKTYPNESSARITPKVGLTDSVTRSVTIEANKIKSSGGQAGIQILGFATIQGQIQQQLSQRYAVAVQRTLTISEEVQIEVPPHKTVELRITWKMEWLTGAAILGPATFGLTRAEVPYFIPNRLTFDWRIRDVPLTKKKGK